MKGRDGSMKRIFGLLLIVLITLLACSKGTTDSSYEPNNETTFDGITTVGAITTQELEVTTNPFCNCGYYQQRPFTINLTLTEILEELESRGYYFVNYTDEYYTYFPEDLLALEQRDLEWYNVTVKYQEIITAYFDTDYGQLQIDVFQMDSAVMASELAHGYFESENCFNAVVIYSNDVIVRMFWYFEDLLNEWEINPACE